MSRSMLVTRIALILGLLVVSEAFSHAQPSLTVGANFSGSTLGVQSNRIPPDTNGAIGPNHFAEMINGRFRIYSTTGTEVQTKSLNQFWTDAGIGSVSDTFDPRVQYDRHSGRWFAATVDNRQSASSNILVAVSATNNPSGSWTGFSIDADSTDGRWADFPTLGVSNNWITVGVNMFDNPGGNAESTVVSYLTIPKTSLTAATPTTTGSNYKQNMDPIITGYTAHAAAHYSNTLTDRTYLLSSFSSSTLEVTRIDGTITSPTYTDQALITTTSRVDPVQGRQPGSHDDIDTGDRRFGSTPVLVQHDGGTTYLWGVRSISATISGEARARTEWFQINPVTNTIVASGIVPLSSATLDAYYPSIAVNESGGIVIGFSASDDSNSIAAYAIAGRYDGMMVNWGTELKIPGGYNASNPSYYVVGGGVDNRWGDYSSVTIDPDDPTKFWSIQEYVSATDKWSTRITELEFSPVPEPGTILGIAALGLGAAAWIRRRTIRPSS